jgi:serine protease Do
MLTPLFMVGACCWALAAQARADESLAVVGKKVNAKLVKLFGSGGYQGLTSYGTGAVVSPDGYILTVYSQMLNTPDLRVHLYNGNRVHAKIVVVEPELDIALLKIVEKVDLENVSIKLNDSDEKSTEVKGYFDVLDAAKKPLQETGTGVLAFSNQFKIATFDEPMSIQRGVIAAYTKLMGRRGIFDAPYSGEVYFIDAITNNPGAAGGVITTRRGELLGLVGKEMRNTLTDTWVNYAIPIGARIEVISGNDKRYATISEMIEKKDQYKPVTTKDKNQKGPGTFHGIVLVPNVVERTPPYVEAVMANSPAAKAGLKPDDLIVYVDGEQVISIKDFKDILDKARPETMLKLEVRRGDKLTSVEIKLEALKKKS